MEVKIPLFDWKPFDKKNPPAKLTADETCIVLLRKRRRPDEPWTYHVDTATAFGSYIDNFWDTEIAWIEGNNTVEVVSYTHLPVYLKEDDLATKGVLYGVSFDGNIKNGFNKYCLSQKTADKYLAACGNYYDKESKPATYALVLSDGSNLGMKKDVYYAIAFETKKSCTHITFNIIVSREPKDYFIRSDRDLDNDLNYNGVIPVDHRPSNCWEMGQIVFNEISKWQKEHKED